MKLKMLATVCGVAMAMAACGPNQTQTAEQSATPPSEQAADAMTPVQAPMDPAAKTLDFATKAAKTDMIEIGISKAAATKTKNADVKKLANMLVTDHTKTSTELKSWAGKTTVALPTSLEGTDQSKIDNIANAEADGFDDKYLDTVIDVHEDAVNAFNDYIQNGQEADLKAWATATLPKLQAHLDAAKALREKINKT